MNNKIKYCPLSYNSPEGEAFVECSSDCAWYNEDSGNCRMLSAVAEIAYQLKESNVVDGTSIYGGL